MRCTCNICTQQLCEILLRKTYLYFQMQPGSLFLLLSVSQSLFFLIVFKVHTISFVLGTGTSFSCDVFLPMFTVCQWVEMIAWNQRECFQSSKSCCLLLFSSYKKTRTIKRCYTVLVVFLLKQNKLSLSFPFSTTTLTKLTTAAHRKMCSYRNCKSSHEMEKTTRT